MLELFDEFRNALDNAMLCAMHSRIVLYGYGYTGKFLKWYADYYHSIKVDYIVSLDMRFGQNYELEIFRKSLFDFDYKDVKNAIVWVAEPMDEGIEAFLEEKGYQRDIQFLEWLEWKYQCNFVTAINRKDLEIAGEHGASYRVTTQKEIFPILDKCHCVPTANDAIFDYGCGKGGAMISFLDYGFQRVGGVEYETKIYNILMDNMSKLQLAGELECINKDAAEVNKELDHYNWFYFFQPFDETIFRKCIDAICKSLERHKRKIHIISIAPQSYFCMEEKECLRLTNQFTIDSRQRVVDVFENY